MRPLRLSMTAFGPYAGTEVVDFDALTELGLFVVAGKNGSGKTTIFDALHYSLYGTLPGRRATYIRLKSDHADDSAECRVVLDFQAEGRLWRVERSPKQTRPKRRGKGTTVVDRQAVLHRLDHGPDGPTTTISNRIGEVDEHCRRLVGLSGKQFERVALLPQGEFSRVLTESSGDRRELLRTLFSSEIFGDATSLLVDEAAEASAADRSAVERIQHRLDALASELQGMHRPADSADRPLHGDPVSLAGSIDGYRKVLARRARQVAELQTRADDAGRTHQRAVDVHERLAQRTELRRQLEQRRANADQHEQDVARLRRALAAVPVAANIRSHETHRSRAHSAEQRLGSLDARLRQVLADAHLTTLEQVDRVDRGVLDRLEPLLDRQAEAFATRRIAADRLADTERQATAAQADVRRADTERRSLDERASELRSALRQARAELDRIADLGDVESCERELRRVEALVAERSELARLEATHPELVQRASELDARIGELEQDHDRADRARTDHDTLRRRAEAAVATHETAVARLEAARQFEAASTSLASGRAELDRARTRADELWDTFIAGSAGRIAQTLVDDKPCPVCGSCSHPQPAAQNPTGQTVHQDDVRAARSRAEELHAQVQRIESTIEQLRSAHHDIASRSVPDLRAEITTTKAMALGAAEVADEAHRSASSFERVGALLRAARQERADLDGELRALEQRRSRLEGALGDVAATPLDSLRAEAERAADKFTTARDLASQRDELHGRVDDFTTRLDAVETGAIAAESRHQVCADRATDLQGEVARARQALDALDAELHVSDFERRAQANRRAKELIGEARTAVALLDEATEATRRARSILDERLGQSPFTSIDEARAAFLDPEVVDQLDAQTRAHEASIERLHGRLQELDDLPDQAPDLDASRSAASAAADEHREANRSLIADTTALDRIEAEFDALQAELRRRQDTDVESRRLERVAALVKGDNERNTSFENWVLGAHLRDVVELANVRLARSTHQRFQLCVLDDGENRRGTWGLDLGVEDTVTGTRRPTAGLSGGELFQASLALALGLADAVMNQTAGVHIDALFIDEGFGSLDETSVERAIDLLDELRDSGAMVGVITHVPALLDSLPIGVRVTEAPDGTGSTILQARRAA